MRAYEALSRTDEAMLEGLTAIHDCSKAHTHRRRDGATRPAVSPGRASGDPHPSGDPAQAAVRQPRFHDEDRRAEAQRKRCVAGDAFPPRRDAGVSCRFKWQKNSIAFWDNRCCPAPGDVDYWPNRRYAHRVTCAATSRILRRVIPERRDGAEPQIRGPCLREVHSTPYHSLNCHRGYRFICGLHACPE